jgi:hypothetical protein
MIETMEPSADLQQRILLSLHEEAQYLRIRRRFTVLFLLLIASVSALPFALIAWFETAQLSGFFDFMSLASSDLTSAFSHWQDVGYSLLESFPVTETIICAVIAAMAVGSLSYVLREYRRVWKHLPLLRVHASR